MSKVSSEKELKVTVNIRRGPAVSSGQIRMWRKFWRKLVSDVRQVKL